MKPKDICMKRIVYIITASTYFKGVPGGRIAEQLLFAYCPQRGTDQQK